MFSNVKPNKIKCQQMKSSVTIYQHRRLLKTGRDPRKEYVLGNLCFPFITKTYATVTLKFYYLCNNVKGAKSNEFCFSEGWALVHVGEDANSVPIFLLAFGTILRCNHYCSLWNSFQQTRFWIKCCESSTLVALGCEHSCPSGSTCVQNFCVCECKKFKQILLHVEKFKRPDHLMVYPSLNLHS